jgi:short-subunit dehydrogenase
MKLDQARIVITGGTGGLGVALARQLAATGASLLLVGRDSIDPASLGMPAGSRFRVLRADLCSADGIDATAAAATAHHANVLINNAGIGGFGLLDEQSPSGIERILAINLAAPIQVTRALLPLLRAQPQATIVNVGSAFGRIPFAGFAAYSASKAGLHAFSQALRRELADSRVRVLHVSPRAIDTPLNTPAVVALNRALGNASDTPEQAAARIVRLLETDGTEAVFGFPERLFAWLNGLAPSLIDRGLRGKLATIKLHAAAR